MLRRDIFNVFYVRLLFILLDGWAEARKSDRKENEKLLFERRLELRIDHEHSIAKQGFLDMYANPVVNKLKYENAV